MCFSAAHLLRERPRQHKLGLEHGVEIVDEAVEGRCQVAMDWMPDPALDVGDGAPRIALIPSPVERLGGDAELDDEVIAEIFRLGLAALFLPQPVQGRLVRAHNDPRVRPADEEPPVQLCRMRSRDEIVQGEFHVSLLLPIDIKLHDRVFMFHIR